MNDSTSRYGDFETLREQAIALRRAGLSLRQIRDELKIFNNDLLNRLVKGEPAPARRHRAKDDLRDRARELRLQGWTYDQIQLELGCSKSSISLWVRDLPKPEPRYTPEEQQALMHAGLARLRSAQNEERERVRLAAHQETADLSDRKLFLVGVALYWAEGSKSKPHARRERVIFVNSDTGVIETFVSWLDLLGVEPEHRRYRILIHEFADIPGAHQHWADVLGVDVDAFSRPTLKRHNPKTLRKNTGDDYHGCLVIGVNQSARLYLRIEGWWNGIAAHAQGRLR
ncbi:hypothetical protein QIS99_10500 [Streptomyces sp. B-S-A8]|uniref:Uncharacterized protein n=1 Tax=Streptomyces solicavernae TaxID=3043614 RepID=A0ABT6RSI6_9ACTN|nr:hypothetical protein [Streptomyces sp. B-S-A8]MDI3386636.1 hypothetical protein [Streptomyces sp. B-S-A8]